MVADQIKYRKDIQVLRGLAVMSVVLFHAKENYFPLGYLGVDTFFIISGFVVTPLILRIFTEQDSGQERLANLKYFYKRRFNRLAPALAVTLVISALSIFLLGPGNDHQRFARQGIATLFLIGNFGAYKYSGDYFNSNPNPLVHTWSLSVEEQIYIFLPIILILLIRYHKNFFKLTSVVFVLITMVSFISFIQPRVLEPIYSKICSDCIETTFSFYSPVSRIWQFTLGGLGFLILDRKNLQFKKYVKLINFILVAALSTLLFGAHHFSIMNNSILVSLIAIMIIIFNSLDIIPKFLSKRLIWLGDRSYSIYLVHMPLIYLAKYSQVAGIGKGENRIIQTVAAVFISIFAGSMSYSKIENRYRGRGNKKTTSMRTVAGALLLSWLLPLTFYATIDTTVNHKYWGLMKNSFRPSNALDSLTGCVENSAKNKICINTNYGATKTVLLIGDSHAGHISLALRDSANIVNWNSVYLQSSKVEEFQNGISDRTINWILKNKPDLIIISQYWQPASPQNLIRSEILNLKSLVPTILLIENNPIWPDISRFNLSGFLVSNYNIPKSFPKSEMNLKEKNQSDQLAKWARTNGIFTMNFEQAFCNQTICTRYSDSGWLYSDYNHLSAAGAALTIPQLSAFLKVLSN
jgi:hypothetical protein